MSGNFKTSKFYISASGLSADLRKTVLSAATCLLTFFKWVLLSVLTGAIGGLVGSAFHKSVEFAIALRQEYQWLIVLLPIGGVAITFLYRAAKLKEDPGTNLILRAVQADEDIPFRLAPLIFVGTAVTQLCGGSAGREGAALQLGGSIGAVTGRIFRLDKADRRTAVLCGMSALFAAVFGTPVTAALFAMEVASAGVMFYSALVPCLLAALTASSVSCGLLGTEAVRLSLTGIPQFSLLSAAQVIGLSVLCAAVSILFCLVMEKTSFYAKKWLSNPYLRAAVGGTLLLALTLLLGTRTYNGTGMDYILHIGDTPAAWYDFLLKLLFTAITIAAGFKGGEIIPTFFVGAAFGSFVGSLLGLSPVFGAAIGIVALFCGVVNCPLASFVLSIEMFGVQGLLFFALASCISYMLSGHYGLYSSQKMTYSKMKAEYARVETGAETSCTASAKAPRPE